MTPIDWAIAALEPLFPHAAELAGLRRLAASGFCERAWICPRCEYRAASPPGTMAECLNCRVPMAQMTWREMAVAAERALSCMQAELEEVKFRLGNLEDRDNPAADFTRRITQATLNPALADNLKALKESVRLKQKSNVNRIAAEIGALMLYTIQTHGDPNI